MTRQGFYMLAGTVMTDHGIHELRDLLNQQQLPAEMVNDEIKIRQQATVYLRPGFAHEVILVGDAREHQALRDLVQRVSTTLKALDLQHSYEIYDTDNNQVEEFEFKP